MPEYRYDPVLNYFTTYEAVETPKVEINLPLLDKPMDITSWSSGVSEKGTPIVKNNLPTATISNSEMLEIENAPLYSSNPNSSGNKKKAYDFFISKGLLPHQAAGIVGNLYVESGGVNHTAVNPTSKAYGLAQWLGSRKKKLFTTYGNNPSFDLQLEFLWNELQTDEKSAFDNLLRARTVEAATDSFMRHFERPSNKEMANSISKRIKYAKSLLS